MSEKIDFATFNGSVFPVVTTEFNMGWNVMGRLTRIANIVMVSSETSVHSYGQTLARYLLGEIIPDGYRPVHTSMFHGMTQDFVAGSDDELCWEVSSDGSMYFSGRAGNTRFVVHGVWVTDDAWPS